MADAVSAGGIKYFAAKLNFWVEESANLIGNVVKGTLVKRRDK